MREISSNPTKHVPKHLFHTWRNKYTAIYEIEKATKQKSQYLIFFLTKAIIKFTLYGHSLLYISPNSKVHGCGNS